MKSLFVAAALAAAAVSASAAAADFYGNAGYTFIDGQGVNLGAVGGKLGWRVNPYLGVEGEAAFGVADDTVNVGVPVKVQLDHAVAAYAVGFYPVNPKFDLFARVGYGNVKIKAKAAGVSGAGDQDGWNAGVGGQYFFTANDGVRVEYTKWGFDDNGVDSDTWSASYVRKF